MSILSRPYLVQSWAAWLAMQKLWVEVRLWGRFVLHRSQADKLSIASWQLYIPHVMLYHCTVDKRIIEKPRIIDKPSIIDNRIQLCGNSTLCTSCIIDKPRIIDKRIINEPSIIDTQMKASWKLYITHVTYYWILDEPSTASWQLYITHLTYHRIDPYPSLLSRRTDWVTCEIQWLSACNPYTNDMFNVNFMVKGGAN